jgi:hypothetical protein
MSVIDIPIPHFFGGVSQQAPALRAPWAVEACENFIPSVVDGLYRRPSSEYVAQAFAGKYGKPILHTIDRSAGERYLTIFDHESVRVFNADSGKEHPVVFGAGASDFSYLNRRSPNLIPYANAEWFLSGTWDKSVDVLVTSTATSGPFGYQVYQSIASIAGAGSSGFIEYDNAGLIFDGSQLFGMFVNMADQTSSEMAIKVNDITVPQALKATFDISGAAPVLSAVDAGVKKTGVVTISDTEFFVYMVVDPADSAIVVGNQRQVQIVCTDFGASEVYFTGWGAFLEEGTDTPSDYLLARGGVRAVTVADSTIVSNDGVTVTASGLSSTQDIQKGYVFIKQGAFNSKYEVSYSSLASPISADVTTWDGSNTADLVNVWKLVIQSAGGAGNTITVSCLGQIVTHTTNGDGTSTIQSIGTAIRLAFQAIQQGFITTRFNFEDEEVLFTGIYRSLELQITETFPGGTARVEELQAITDAEFEDTKTNLIAGGLVSKLANPSITAVSSSGSLITIEDIVGGGFSYVTTSDSAGDTLMNPIYLEVEALRDLPRRFYDGVKVKIVGTSEVNDIDDDYWVKFDANGEAGVHAGTWKESNGSAIIEDLDRATMPHQLISLQDDSAGTITGEPNAIYFEWGQVPYDSRLVGDDVSAPMPSFVGNTITDVFFHRGRLGFLSDQNVVLSEVSSFFNFFRTTILTLLDSDPIDIAANHTRVSVLRGAAGQAKQLVVFSDRTQFVLEGEPILSPASASLRPIMEYESLAAVSPEPLGTGVYFPYKQGDFSGVREIFPANINPGFGSSETTQAVPKYIQGKILEIAGSSSESAMVILADGETDVLVLYTFARSGGEEVQSSWTKMRFANATILGMGWIESELYLLMDRSGSIEIERMTIGAGQTETGLDFILHMDRRITEAELTSNVYGGGPSTVLTLPYTIIGTPVVSNRDTGAGIGIVSSTSTTITVSGDRSATNMFIGETITSLVTLSTPFVRSQSGRGLTPVINGEMAVLGLQVAFSETGAVEAAIDNRYNADLVVTLAGGHSDETPQVEDFSSDVGIFSSADEVAVTLQTSDPLPCKIQSAQWTVEFEPASRRT